MSAPNVPAFDPESPDAAILEAFEKVRAYRADVHCLDVADLDESQEAALERAGNVAIGNEDDVYGNVATTIPGVAARLQLLVTGLDCERWVDRCLVEQGFLALYHVVENLDGHAQQVAYAVHELINIEWEQNLAAYEKSAADFDLVLNLKGLAETEGFRLADQGEPPVFLRAITALCDQLEERFSNEREISRLIRTLTPDHAAYLRKVEIILAEQFGQNATPWLARDTAYLAGRMPRSDKKMERADAAVA